jgi:hypothetical protein
MLNSAVIELRIRDLRRLDSDFNRDGPVVLVRRHAILFSFDPIRSIIMGEICANVMSI